MALFSYQAVRRDGGRVTGQVEAQSRTEAFRKLDRESLQPITLVQQEGIETNGARTPEVSGGLATRNIRLSGSQIILFTEEMSDLLDAGLPLEQALGVM
jgi:general secretion pathway protein F